MFATDLGSGVYDLDGRTLQIYRFTYEKDLREADGDTMGVRFVLPVTFGFFDFTPFDVLSEGIPTRVDSFSMVPGIELDYLLRERLAFDSLCARRRQRRLEQRRWLAVWHGHARSSARTTGMAGIASCAASSIIAGVGYRHDVPDDAVRAPAPGIRSHARHAAGRSAAASSSSACTASSTSSSIRRRRPWPRRASDPLQAEFGFTFSTRPAFKIWRFDAPRLGFGYRLAGELSAWHFLIGVPF